MVHSRLISMETCWGSLKAGRSPIILGALHTAEQSQQTVFPVSTKHLYTIYTMLDQLRRRWAYLYKCYTNVLRLLGLLYLSFKHTLQSFSFAQHHGRFHCVRTSRDFYQDIYRICFASTEAQQTSDADTTLD